MPADAKVAASLSMTRVQMNMPPLDIPDTCILAVSTHSRLVTSYSTAFIILIVSITTLITILTSVYATSSWQEVQSQEPARYPQSAVSGSGPAQEA